MAASVNDFESFELAEGIRSDCVVAETSESDGRVYRIGHLE